MGTLVVVHTRLGMSSSEALENAMAACTTAGIDYDRSTYKITPSLPSTDLTTPLATGLIQDLVVGVLVEEAGVERVELPLGSWVLASPGLSTADKVFILIQGSGGVRAGQWSRSLCRNETLKEGSILPHVMEASRQGYSLLILNPNHNTDEDGEPIPGSESQIEHTQTVMDLALVQDAHPLRIDDHAHVVMMVHSFGGRCVQSLLSHPQLGPLVSSRVSRLALTDSRYSPQQDRDALAWLGGDHVRHWVASDLPLDTPILPERGFMGTPCVSAGTVDHASTNHVSLSSILSFLFPDIS